MVSVVVSVRLLTLAELREGRMRACTVEGREILVCRTKAGVFALDNVCTHAFARMSEGSLRGTQLTCPLHGARFDVRDGRVLRGPATQPLKTYATRIVDGAVEVTIPAGESSEICRSISESP